MTAAKMPPVAATSASARRFLIEHLGGDVEMGPDLRQGVSSRAHAFRHGGRDLVVRFNPERHSFDIDLQAERFRAEDLPIPEMLEVGEVEGGFFAMSERAFGEFLGPADLRLMQEALLGGYDSTHTRIGDVAWRRRYHAHREVVACCWPG